MATKKVKKTLRINVNTKLNPFGNVVNLSENLFAKKEFSLLHENLNFCRRPSKYNKQHLSKDLLKFYRNIKHRAHFESTKNNSDEPGFKSYSNCLPDKLRRKLKNCTVTS